MQPNTRPEDTQEADFDEAVLNTMQYIHAGGNERGVDYA
jgi:hypothetical protein